MAKIKGKLYHLHQGGAPDMGNLKCVTIYTDGGCTPNPGAGGYGVVLQFGLHRRELSAGYRLTTNNRMEMLAAIAGLRALTQPCQVLLYSDSKYLVDAMHGGWPQRWAAKGWKRSEKHVAANSDLWIELLRLCYEHDVEFTWIKGHARDSDNERCDRLATVAARGTDLLVDEGFGAAAPAPLFDRSY